MGATQRVRNTVHYYNIINGKFARKVTEDTIGAVKRQTQDKTTKEIKDVYELLYDDIDGFIYNVEFVTNTFRNLAVSSWKITVTDVKEGEPVMVIMLPDGSSEAADFLSKLPNVDFEKPVLLSPSIAAKKNKDGKVIENKFTRHLWIKQGDKYENEIGSYFYNTATKSYINGFPVIGITNPDSDDWKSYFITVKKFLKRFFMENILPKLEEGGTKDDNFNANEYESHTEVTENEEPDLPF